MLRAFAGGVVLAGALSTLAGGAGSTARPGDSAVAVSGRAALRPAHAAARASGTDAVTATKARGRGAFDPLPALTAAVGAPHNAMPVDPPPHAPGGDDLLATSEPLPPQHQAAAGGAIIRAPAPRLWLDRPRVALGETAVLHLALTDAQARCRGADALAGVAIVGHRTELRATVAGRHRLTVVCSNPGGTVDAAVLLTVPLPVQPSTGDRRPSPHQGLTPLPGLRQLGLQAVALAGGVGHPDLIAIGDFLQEGQPSLFAVAAGPGGAPVAHVLARDAAGRWADRSDDLLDAAQRAVCPAAVQLVSADFNQDGLPDVWVACHGRQLLFLSQADGRYRRIETPFSLTARQTEARDVDGDGWPDIVTLDTAAGSPRTLLLLGRGDGRFDTGPAEAWRLALP